MIKAKWLLATTIGLVSAATPLFAAPARSDVAAAVRSTSPAVQAENISESQPASEGAAHGPAVPETSATIKKNSFYAGFGIDLLNNRGFTGLMPKAMAGYGFFYGTNKDYYTALEVGGGAGTILLSSNNQRYRVAGFANASILPGYMIYDDVLLYARLGAQATRYSQLNSTIGSGLYGVGLELFNGLRSKHWDYRVEYNYANNKNLSQFIIDIVYRFGC